MRLVARLINGVKMQVEEYGSNPFNKKRRVIALLFYQ